MDIDIETIRVIALALRVEADNVEEFLESVHKHGDVSEEGIKKDMEFYLDGIEACVESIRVLL